MRKKILTVCILFTVIFRLYAQKDLIIPSPDEINRFLKSTTYIVLEDAIFSDYNEIVKETINNFWTISNFKYIKESEFDKYRKDKNSSFLMKSRVYFEKDKTSTKFEFLSLCLGGQYKTITDMPDICAIPLCYEGEDEDNYTYKLPVIIRFIQKHILMLKQNPKLTDKKIIDYYSSLPIDLNKKTFYLLENEVSPEINKPASFKKLYNYNFKFSNTEEIKDLIMDNNSDILVLHLVGPTKSNTKNSLQYCVKIIFDNSSNEIIFYDKHKVDKNKGKYILSSDIKKLNTKK